MTNRRDPSPENGFPPFWAAAAWVPTGEVDQEDGIITDPARHGCEGSRGGSSANIFCFF